MELPDIVCATVLTEVYLQDYKRGKTQTSLDSLHWSQRKACAQMVTCCSEIMGCNLMILFYFAEFIAVCKKM